ncbi:MAG: (2Fe-2S)-binding protein [Candidatus Heimdallarchaeota archaeon]|nr:(2Fe-2S)-binding protein [Candidatus Heimdallarchaeota archaeon]
MPIINIDGIEFNSPEGWSILEVARFLGIEIPTLCHDDGLSPWGACRLCLVEIIDRNSSKLVSSCTHPVSEGLNVRTVTERVLKTRNMVLELLISEVPSSKVLQDLASKLGLNKARISPKWKDCILCGKCVRICEEQMMAKAIQFIGRGQNLEVSPPFDINSDLCRQCGACMYICPVVTQRCDGPNATTTLCNGCYNETQPTCYDDMNYYDCWMGLKGECGTCYQVKNSKKEE